MENSSHFVSTDWLSSNLQRPDLVVVDASWYLPTMNRNGREEYERQHIHNAVFFDIDVISDRSNPLPHMLPNSYDFAKDVGQLGIGDDMTIVVYDGAGLFTAPRVWWTLRAFGAKNVKILRGGLPKWLAEGRPVDDEPVNLTPRSFTAHLDQSLIARLDEVKSAVAHQNCQIIDARPAARFRGEAAEPRPHVRSGHMPHSQNIPFTDVIADGALKEADELRAIFAEAGVDLTRPIITSCGSGVSAAILTLALDVMGVPMGRLYDGSWSEWGGIADLPLETGAA